MAIVLDGTSGITTPALDSAARFASADMPLGSVIQVQNVQTGLYGSTTSGIPTDDTIPQNTEGAELFTLAITPTSATSKLLISVSVFLSQSVSGAWMTAALFQDSTSNALAASTSYQVTSTAGEVISFNYYMTAGTTSATTFKIRYGGTGGNTIAVNGSGAARLFGGVCSSSMTITEIAA